MELLSQSEIKYFSKVKEKSLTFELVTRSVTFYI